MTLAEYNDFCAYLPHTTHVVQWGGSHVWKIGGKVFAIAGGNSDSDFRCSFKVSELAFDILKEQPGCQGAPHLASRGMKWIQRFSDEAVDDDALRDYLRESYRLVSRGLTKKLQRELGLNQS
ncbi:MmcQ/YjbR family DNA-binding protein [Henriciella marina]|uniref:MmcQ/YjbR family DNA-binding protein n=1 Tax=Henriciella marina TaxID=453851 RepID=UPI00036D9708|nr:MmcQ/YjbR family DNA-binding protein [Henriciella marina]